MVQLTSAGKRRARTLCEGFDVPIEWAIIHLCTCIETYRKAWPTGEKVRTTCRLLRTRCTRKARSVAGVSGMPWWWMWLINRVQFAKYVDRS